MALGVDAATRTGLSSTVIVAAFTGLSSTVYRAAARLARCQHRSFENAVQMDGRSGNLAVRRDRRHPKALSETSLQRARREANGTSMRPREARRMDRQAVHRARGPMGLRRSPEVAGVSQELLHVDATAEHRPTRTLFLGYPLSLGQLQESRKPSDVADSCGPDDWVA